MREMQKGAWLVKIKKYTKFLIYFCVISVLAIVIDQITKYVALNFLEMGVPVAFIPHFIEFTLTLNKGAAWGMGDGAEWSRILLTIISWVVAIFLIGYVAYMIKKEKEIDTLYGISLALILGGDIGNLIDRTFFYSRGVIDFISIQSWWKGFGIFNIADSCLVVGIFLLLIYFIIVEVKEQKAQRDHNIKVIEQIKANSEESNNEKDINKDGK